MGYKLVNNTTQSMGNQINGFRIYVDELHEALLDENLCIFDFK